MTPSRIGRLLAGLLALVLARAAVGATSNAFFAMDTAVHGGSPAEQALLLKELGYDGIGTTGYPAESFLAAFKKEGLKVYNTYLVLSFDSAKPGLDPALKACVPRLKDHGTALWISIKAVTRDGAPLASSASEGDDVVLQPLRELADLCQSNRVSIAFYPHTDCWLERVGDAVRLAGRVDRPNVGATFNLCHFLKVEGDKDPRSTLKLAVPHLLFVTVNGAERGDTRAMSWDKLIQPLGAGSYDVAGLLRSLRELGYQGPIGFQGFGIPGDSRELLSRTMKAWRQINAP